MAYEVTISPELAALAVSVMREAAGALFIAPWRPGNRDLTNGLREVARELDRKLSAAVRKEAQGGS